MRRVLAVLLAAVMLAMGARAATAPTIDPLFDPVEWTIAQAGAGELTEPILQAAKESNLDPLLLAALVWQESSFRCDVPGDAGELGPCQLRPHVVERYQIDPCDPWEGTSGGAKYLALHLSWCNSYEKALRVYNGGRGKMNSKAARNYSRDVLRKYSELKEKAAAASMIQP